MGGDRADPGKAFDEGSVNFLGACWWERRFAGVFRFRFGHVGWGWIVCPIFAPRKTGGCSKF